MFRSRQELQYAADRGMATDVLYSVGGNGQDWLPCRSALQRQATAAPCTQAAVTSPLKAVRCSWEARPARARTPFCPQHRAYDPHRYLLVGADRVREFMIRLGMVPAVPGLTPIEASALVQREAAPIVISSPGRARGGRGVRARRGIGRNRCGTPRTTRASPRLPARRFCAGARRAGRGARTLPLPSVGCDGPCPQYLPPVRLLWWLLLGRLAKTRTVHDLSARVRDTSIPPR